MSGPFSGCRILIVEDEVMVSWLLEDMLIELDCKIIGPAARLDEALAIIGVEPIDAVVLDVNLNGEKSFPIADTLAAHGIPFVLSSGYDKSGIEEDYHGAIMLQKPYKSSQLRAALAAVLLPKERS